MSNSSQDLKKYGLRIYTIIKNGPLDKSGVKELTDFIIPPEEVITSQITFAEWVQTHANQEVVISFYSLLTKKFRDLKIKTNRLGSNEGVIGASVGKENWTTANKNVLHVLSVKEDSFAKKELGLIPNEDYIVGVKCMSSPIIPLNNDELSPLEILSEVINKNKGNPVKFYIYNKIKGARDVTAVIGKEYYFSLGLEGAYGALHMFPSLDMEKVEVNNDVQEIKPIIEENKNVNDNKGNIDNKEISKENNKEEIKENNENIIINKQNNNSDINENNNNNTNVDAKEKTENETKENNIIIKEDDSTKEDNKEEKPNEIIIEKDSNNEKEISNANEQNQIRMEETVQTNKNEISTPNSENINKIVEEISVEKNLETNPETQEEEESKKELKEQKQINSQESIPITENKETEDKEEIKIEIREEQKKEEIVENKEENNKINEDNKKEEEKNNEENDIKRDINTEEGKKEEKEEEKEEKEEEKEDENKNNTHQSSGNKNKRRKKRNKH